jgi:alpha-tubulin suppressor-like RCC1 family protein
MSCGAMTAGPTRLRRRGVRAVVSLGAGLGLLVAVPHAAQAVILRVTPRVSISTGLDHICALESGRAYCWGQNATGDLTNSGIPVAVGSSGVLAGKTLTQITAGGPACALDSSGAAYCWGYTSFGDLGSGGTTGTSSVPVAVDTSGVLAGKTLIQITAGAQDACALGSTGAAYCWGYGEFGQLGDGSGADSSVPVAVDTSGVLAGKTLTQISDGAEEACALDSSGAAYCWGRNDLGELGDGSTADSSVPVAVDTSGVLAGKILTQITAGAGHTCAVDSSGAAYCWGSNGSGSLGDGSSAAFSSVPVAVDTSGVLAGKTLTQITTGDVGACALDSSGAAYCWGDNRAGELGDGSTASSGVPVAVDTSGVLAGRSLTQIGTDASNTCALDSTGATYCWGLNKPYGMLGAHSSIKLSTVPVLAGPQAPTGVTAVQDGTTATVSWTAPHRLDGGTLTGYTAQAVPGGAACSTAGKRRCTITGLAAGTTYSVTVIAHTTVGDSGASAPTTMVDGSPRFTSTASAAAVTRTAFTFPVTTSGSPAPTITKSGRLPAGVRFTEGKHGTATIAGTPKSGTAGTYPVTLTARNTGGTTTQSFTLTVTVAP